MLNSFFTDKYSAYIFLGILLIYLIISAYFRFNQLFWIPLDLLSLTVLIPILLTDGIKIAIESIMPKKYYPAVEDLSKVTVIIPTKDGEDTLPSTLDHLIKRFPKESIIVASNGSTDQTVNIAQQYSVGLVNIPQAVGKVEAINIAMSEVATPYTLIMDDDTLLGEAIVPTNALDNGYEAAAFKLLPKKEGWLSVLQLHEYRKSMDIGRCFHNSRATVQSVSGAIGLFHTKELKRQINLHTGEFSGEDLQRTLLILVSNNRKGVVIVDSLVETYVPNTISMLFNQRIFGWNPGFIANFKLYLKLIFAKNVPFALRYEAFFSIFIITVIDPFRLISLPVLLFSPTFLLLFYVSYVLLETIPYLSMGRKEPYWVVLMAPIYGLFNFIARMASLASFTFRRFTYFLDNGERFDDYRKAPLHARFQSLVLTIIFFTSIMSSYTFFRVIPAKNQVAIKATLAEATKISPQKPTSQNPTLYAAQSQNQKSINIPNNSTTKNDFQYQIKSGDNLWKLSKKATDSYLQQEKIYLTKEEHQQLIYQLVQAHTPNQLFPGQTFTIKYSTLNTVTEKFAESLEKKS